MERDRRIVENLRDYNPTFRRRPADEKDRQGNLPVRKWFTSISHPPSVTAGEAGRIMRDDDYVIGLFYKGLSQATPLWWVDYYHSVNQTIGGEPVVLFS